MCEGLKQLLKEERRKGYIEGFIEGYREGYEEARKERAKAIISYFIGDGMSEDETVNETQKILSFIDS